ncbi:MAG: RHS repeat-associated core domain-containing protein, partial [Caldilineaceae bacterium]|nr:RHS repeat-associated core domain-containing protein [Caldilineaceae bacterium]
SGSFDHDEHQYLSSTNQVLEVRLDSSTSAAMQNVWGERYIDDLVLRDRTVTTPLDERLYCLQDANWNTVALVDDGGSVVQTFDYQPYGECTFLSSSYGASTNLYDWTTLFTGRELDLESKLYYFRARYLHSKIGTFLSRDPLGYVDGLNAYRAYFVPDGLDPTGLQLNPDSRYFWDIYADTEWSEGDSADWNILDEFRGRATMDHAPDCPDCMDRLSELTGGTFMLNIKTRVTKKTQSGKSTITTYPFVSCNIRLVCADCPHSGGTTFPELGLISICINSKKLPKRDLDMAIHHEMIHSRQLCKEMHSKEPDKRTKCQRHMANEREAYAASCRYSHPDTNSMAYLNCVDDGVAYSSHN